MNWRDETSQVAQDDLDKLANTTLAFATEQLEAHGEFYPFAHAVDLAGGLTALVPPAELGEHPESAAVAEALIEVAKERIEQLRAVAFVADVTAEEFGGDAVRVLMEHREGTTVALYLPYSVDDAGAIAYGDLRAGVGSTRVW